MAQVEPSTVATGHCASPTSVLSEVVEASTALVPSTF